MNLTPQAKAALEEVRARAVKMWGDRATTVGFLRLTKGKPQQNVPVRFRVYVKVIGGTVALYADHETLKLAANFLRDSLDGLLRGEFSPDRMAPGAREQAKKGLN